MSETPENHPPPTSSRPKHAGRKVWAFRLIALVGIPALLFGGLEIGLRLAGFGYPTKALIEREFDGRTMCMPNAQFGWRFFPHQMAREFDSGLYFEKKKAPGTFRIFVLGGSAARGTPEQVYSFGRVLEAMLGAMYPDTRFEVYNAAMTAINSHVVLEIAKDCARYEPDLFVVYMGNNEVVGPFGPGTVLTSAPPSLPLIRASNAIKATRIGQLGESLLGSSSSGGSPTKKWAGMAMFLDKQVRADSAAMKPVYHHFERNLRDICRVARRAGAQVIVSNVPVNLRECPPFASLHRTDLGEQEEETWQESFEEGVRLENGGIYRRAVERYEAAAAIDDSHAELQFRLGRSNWEVGEFEKARSHYHSAMRHDTLRFRADERINRVIRTVADGRSGEGIRFADSVAAFEAGSPHRIPGTNLFYEHVHLNFAGNCLLARTIFPHIQAVLPPDAKPRGDLLGQEQVARRIAYTKFDEFTDLQTMYQEYLDKPPFTNQIYHEDMMRELRAAMEILRRDADPKQCLQIYDQAIRENPHDWRLLFKQYKLIYTLQGERDLKFLETLARKLVEVHPHDRGFVTLGNVLTLQGRFDEAEEELNRALILNPASGKARHALAILCMKRDDTAACIRHLQEGIAFAPADSITTYRLLATQYDQTGRTDQAVRTLESAVGVFPEKQTALLHCHLGELLNKRGRREEALKHMETALRIEPDLSRNDTFRHQYDLIKEEPPGN